MGYECGECIFHRGYLGILKATDDPSVRFRALRSLFQMLSENVGPEAVPSVLGTMRERIIRKVTGNPDPYADVKRISNEKALAVLPVAEKLICTEASDEMRFRRACLLSIVGNVMEFEIVGYKFEFGDLNTLLHKAEEDLVIDDTPEAFAIARESSLILYLVDNAWGDSLRHTVRKGVDEGRSRGHSRG
ncbi:MAG: ARMT1-like domain-containing protein [Candidatus Bathyarchaeia archaeon]